ncbi:NAD(P)-dependent oxidoreductase, partial [Pseudomonas sp. 2995-1]|uniref:SDR family oxidoreductase n=1 Tax=Pseudomonas sp. 2995-1 TaxID=1712679 RepID=UPI001179DC87
DYVFDGEWSTPYNEEQFPSPVNHYGYTKWLAEEYIRCYKETWRIIRTSWLFGGEGSNFVKTIAEKSRRNEKVAVVDDQVGSPTHVSDLSLSILNIMSAPSGVY